VVPPLGPPLRLFTAALALTACSSQPQPVVVGEVSVPTSTATEAFPEGVAADYQLGGAYPPPEGVRLVVRDSTAQPENGLYNICYVNGFQTQPADRELWLTERRDLVLFGKDGQPLVDPNWPDELILDTSTAEKRTRLAVFVSATITTCATSGFDAVEIDNLDSDTRSHGAISLDDNLAFAAQLAEAAHSRNMLIGQKNSAELGGRGRDEAGFDFAVAEECLAFGECSEYTATYGQRVVDVEYTDNLPSGGVCAEPDRPRTTVVRDRYLVPAGGPGYSYARC
jgi:glycosyl hydrolase family 114